MRVDVDAAPESTEGPARGTQEKRLKAGATRRRQMRQLRRQARVRNIVIRGEKVTTTVITCPPPMDCTPVDSQQQHPLRR